MKNRYWITGILGLSLAGPLSAGAFAQSQTAPANQPVSTQTVSNQPAQKSVQKPVQKKNEKKSADKKSKSKAVDADSSAEPDKVLYDRAVADIKHSRYTEGRLAFQTLINTYPDSEYLAKAKLGVADSYYKEGGTSNLTESVSEYKDFITFFPFLDEAAYAQLQVGMAYYRMMEKADRDKTQGEQAEDALQTFILKYPQNGLLPKAEQQLRNVQEIIADGQYKTARFYYLKQDYRPAAARLIDLTQRYPLYSESDSALFMLGDIYSRAKQVSKSEDDKNHWADLSAECYGRIVQLYPLSRLASDAKSRLKAMNMPVPTADPNALARMQQQQLYDKQQDHRPLIHLPGGMMGIVTSSPDFSAASHFGVPNLTPPDDNVSALDVLKPGAAGPDFELSARRIDQPDGSAASAAGDVTPVQSTGAADLTPAGSSVGAEIISGPANSTATTDASSSSSSDLPAPLAPTTPQPDANAPGSAATQPDAQASQAASVTSTQTPQASSGTSGQQEAQAAEPQKADSSTESTSKKKKGLHKLNPF